ncbi:MAG: C40 family peptidase [Bacteroidia bacterium]
MRRHWLVMAALSVSLAGCGVSKKTLPVEELDSKAGVYLKKKNPPRPKAAKPLPKSPAPTVSSKPSKAPVAAKKKEKNPALGKQVVRHAMNYLGVPYRLGGMDRKGMDCSGFTCRVYQEVGYSLPRTARLQWEKCQPLSLARVAEGDLIFFKEPRSKTITHVGIVIRTEPQVQFIHASSSRGVRIDYLDDAHWKKRFFGVRRCLP